MGDCCAKLYKEKEININKLKRGRSNPNAYNKKKENNFSNNSIINNHSIKKDNSLNSKVRNKNIYDQSQNKFFDNYHYYLNSNLNKLRNEKESGKKMNNINKINNFNKKAELPIIAKQNNSNGKYKNKYSNQNNGQPVKLLVNNQNNQNSINNAIKYNNNIYSNNLVPKNINKFETKILTNNCSTNSSYLINKSNSNNKKNINPIKDNQNEKDKDWDKQSKKSIGNRNKSYDPKNLKNYNNNNIIDYNNNNNININKEKEIRNSNEKEKESNRSKHVSVNKYKKVEEKLRKSYQKYEIDCENKEMSSTISTKPKGLYNLGLSCYINSLLQCLFYIKELRDYFIKEKNNFRNDQVVCRALSEVMYGLKYDHKDYFEAKQFKKEMGNKNSLFFGVRAGDSKDLFINLIDSILTETTIENSVQWSNSSLDLTNKMKVFNETKREIDMNNIINKIFIGFYETKYKCLKSKDSIYSFSSESFISFNLEKISNYFENNNLTIENCFEYNYDRTYKTSFHCSKCNRTENNISNDIIYIPPKIFVIVLDRGKGKTFKGNVSIDINLNIEHFIDNNEYKKYSNYQLIGVSTHSGTSSSSGHYTACCLTDNGKYYYFSDTYVHEISESKLFENEPYLLFYQRI